MAGQYEVVGCLAHGGFGWIYLAKDRNVSNRWVVLKGLLDSGNEEARAAALAERQFLATMEHPGIVKIYNFVPHRGAEYIVMEYVGGKSLKTILKDRRMANGDKPDPLPVDMAIAYMIGILPALSYLHDHGYLFCDFKPDNVIHQGDQLKLIDLGGVRRIGDNDGNVYGTVGFQAPEIATVGPSVSSDIYTVIRSLAVLCLDFPGYTKQLKHDLPATSDTQLFQEFDSVRRLMLRATATDASERFQSIDELQEQLVSVLREVVSVKHGVPRPGTSGLFTSDLVAMRGDKRTNPDWRALPIPLIVATDPAASYLMNLSAPADQIPAIVDGAVASGQIADSVETRLRKVRAHLESDDLQAAIRSLSEAEVIAPTDWRIRWYEGLVAMARPEAHHVEAVPYFDAVTGHWPGELAPRVALAHALELTKRDAEAAVFYDRVSLVDPSYAFAIFGLGRCRAREGDRAGAVKAYARISPNSILHGDAKILETQALLESEKVAPNVDEVVAAAASVQGLSIDAKHRAELARNVLEHALRLSEAGEPGDGRVMFGEAFGEKSIRSQLESVYRQLARQETNRAERVRLVDMANKVRNRTLV